MPFFKPNRELVEKSYYESLAQNREYDKEQFRSDNPVPEVWKRLMKTEFNNPYAKPQMVRCLFHSPDNNPSMALYDDKYKCYACFETGDVFNLVAELEGLDIVEDFKKICMLLDNAPDKPDSETVDSMPSRAIHEQRTEPDADELARRDEVLTYFLSQCKSDVRELDDFKKSRGNISSQIWDNAGV